jgi:MinD-like ATPase involved in chromosome partitioning or flagellar assembly
LADDHPDRPAEAVEDFAADKLSGRQPPFGSRASLGPEPPEEWPEAESQAAGPDSLAGWPGTWATSEHETASSLGSVPERGPSAYGPDRDGRQGHRRDNYGPDGYGPPRSPEAAAEPYGLDAYAPADPHDLYEGRPYGYGSADPYGQDLYGPTSQFGAADPYGAVETYGPTGTYDVPAAQSPPPGAAHAAPPQQGPARSAAAAGYGPAEAPGPADPLAGPPEAAGAAPVSARAAAGPTENLTPEYLLPGRRRAPSPGWRRVIYQATGGLMRVPSSGAELRRRDMISRVRAPVAGGHHRVAVMSLKGGVGKTTTTMGLGSTLASLRGDRIIAVDANPDRGTLSDKVGLETAATVRDLLNERGQIRRYADVRTFTSQAASRLEVLASDRDPTVSVAFSGQDYCNVAQVLEHYYSICLTDCGTGLLHSAMSGVLRMADQIVLVSTPSVDGARSASATLDWLAAHSYEDLVRDAVVVLSAVRPRSRSTVDLNRLEEHFAARCRAVTRVPYDPHLEEGAEVELEQLSRATADAYLALAAVVGDGLASPRARGRAQPSALPRR